jgi:HPt (histidine-containing phosphotransfer) domain-containing protein
MAASSPLRSAGSQEPSEAIDDDHLARMTLGDQALEREVLEIFLRQATLMIERIEGSAPGLAAAAAHTLTGSARGIGAWRVAQAAERLEQAAGHAGEAALDEAVDALKAAAVEAGAAINARLGKALREH